MGNCLELPSTSTDFYTLQNMEFEQNVAVMPQSPQVSNNENRDNVMNFDSDDSVADRNYVPESEEEIDESENDVDDNIIKGKKRKSHPDNWKKSIYKRKVLGGKERQTKKGTIKEKRLGSPCTESCKLKCSEKISVNQRNLIHTEFWNQNKNIDIKRQFVAAMVQCIPVSRIRETNGKRSGRREFTRIYAFDVNKVRITVCQKFFLSTLNISETFVTTALRKKADGGLTTQDQRGRHESVNKIADFIKQGVREHINKFPLVESHYSRERSSKKYLGNDLNISRMYELYRSECMENNTPDENIAKSWLYSEIFNTEFNLCFKLPYNDTCDECDRLMLAKTQADGGVDGTPNIDNSLQQHLAEAGNRYALKREDKEKAVQSQGKIKMVTVDLQKCLPTPVLTNQQSFYKLKLWTYNYTISDSGGNTTTCLMWDESKSGRGANQMASGFFKWISTLSETVSEIYVWSDNCPSQNRNMIMVVAYFWIMHNYPNIKIINHKFLLRGHTHMEVDGDHSLIERERKKTPFLKIMTPWDWQQLARLCCRSKPFNAINMELVDFKDFKTLYNTGTSPFTARKKTLQGSDFLLSRVVHLQIRSNDIGLLFFKTDFMENSFECVDLKRTSRRASFPTMLPLLHAEGNVISTKKYNHLQSLLQWVPSEFQNFYKNLRHSDNASDDI